MRLFHASALYKQCLVSNVRIPHERTSMWALFPWQRIKCQCRGVIRPRETHDLESVCLWKEQQLVWFVLSHGSFEHQGRQCGDAERTMYSFCNCIEPRQSTSFSLEECKTTTKIYLLGVKANLCLHNSQYSFRLCFSHCTKLGKHRKGTEHRVRVRIRNKCRRFLPFLFFFFHGQDRAFHPGSVLLHCRNILWTASLEWS